jgi:N-acetyl-anhydromuramyl-L-alanine amidase AmpD
MKKSLIYKSITIIAALLIIAAVIFLPRRFSGKEKKNITAENNPGTADILSDESFGKANVPATEEPEKTPEKSEAETQKESVTAEPPKNTDDEASQKLVIVDKLLSGGFQAASGRKIDTIIIHSSYDAIGSDPYSVNGIISEFKSYGVSAHYLIARDGTIYRLVKESDIAYHAGVSQTPDGRTNVNDFSIGIELINTKGGKFTENQYAALNILIDSLKAKYKIKYVLGHNQIAPGRKDDPWNFDWGKLD